MIYVIYFITNINSTLYTSDVVYEIIKKDTELLVEIMEIKEDDPFSPLIYCNIDAFGLCEYSSIIKI